MFVAIHVNPSLAHQVDHGERWRKGFARHGIAATVTNDPSRAADIHVISGPWFAKKQWTGHPRVIGIDRAWCQPNPEYVSVGWLRADGGYEYRKGTGRQAPVKRATKSGERAVYLMDYNGAPLPLRGYGGAIHEVRRHPSNVRPRDTLADSLNRNAIAVGYMTTALAVAALAGLRVVCLDPRSLMARPDWWELLPYADWTLDEIENGDVWEHLK